MTEQILKNLNEAKFQNHLNKNQKHPKPKKYNKKQIKQIQCYNKSKIISKRFF